MIVYTLLRWFLKASTSTVIEAEGASMRVNRREANTGTGVRSMCMNAVSIVCQRQGNATVTYRM